MVKRLNTDDCKPSIRRFESDSALVKKRGFMNREHQQEIDRNTLLHSTTATVAEKEDALDRLLEASYKDGLDNRHES